MQLIPLLLLLLLAAFCPVLLANPSWKLVPTANNYGGKGESAFSICAPNKLCLLGGRGANRVQILDTTTLQWSNGQSNNLEMHHFQAVYGPDGCVWVAGAWTGPFPKEDNVQNIWKYCLQTDSWEQGPTIPRPRGAGGAIFYGGKLYLISGNDGGHNKDAVVVPWFDCYDPETGKWTQLADVPNPRDHFHVAIIDDKLYVAGGRFSTSNYPEFFSDVATAVDVYDFTTATWTTMPDFPRPRGGTAAVTFENSVVVLGGESERKLAWSEIDILRGNKFVPGPDMPDTRHGTGAVSCNGAIWIAGGARSQGGGNNSVETYAYYRGGDSKPPPCDLTSTSAPPTTSTSKTEGTTQTSATKATTMAPSTTAPTTATQPVTTTPGASSSSTTSPSTSAPSSTSVEASTPNRTTRPPLSSTSSSITTGSTPVVVKPSPSGPIEESNEPITPSEEPSEPVCFPADAEVELENGSFKQMRDLKIGDRVKVAHGEFSEVFFFSHRHPNALTNAIRIETSIPTLSLTLSKGHLLYVNGRLTPASSVRVGDILEVHHGNVVTVTVKSVSQEEMRGLYNPHTLHGDVFVNKIRSSAYTTTVHPAAARALLSPLSLAFRILGARHSESLNRVLLRAGDLIYWR